MRPYQLREGLEKEFKKLAKKDPARLRAINKKIKEIRRCDDPTHYKNLQKPLQHLKRVHIGSYVLTFSVKGETIIFEEFEHHDTIYEQ